MDNYLTEEERRRYSRQIAIEEIGVAGQQRLGESKVFIVGCGALGSMVAMQLAGAGVGSIGISDFDTIDVSNLQRQFFFKTDEAGMKKCLVLQQRIEALNPSCQVLRCDALINKERAVELFSDYDFIVDATDNPSSKFIIESVCQQLDKPCSIAGVSEFHGQVMTVFPGSTKFGEVFPDSENEGFLPCSISGVVGPAAAICASLQSAEVIKYLTGAGECLKSKLMVFDLLNNSYNVISI